MGREYKRGRQEGLKEGLKEGLHEGRQEGERALLSQLIQKRFGSLPEWANQRLSQASEQELSNLSNRLFEAQTLEELLR